MILHEILYISQQILPHSHQGSRPVNIFFRRSKIFFRGPNFLPGGQGIWPAREKKLLGIPAAGPASTHPEQDIFSQSAKKYLARPPTGQPQAGRAQPIRESLEEQPQLGCQPRKKKLPGPWAARPCENNFARPACHRPCQKKKLPGIPAAARSSIQAGQLLFFAKNLAGKKFGTDLGSLLCR